VWALALPAIGEQLLALGVGASDTFLSGHLATTASRTLGYDQATAVAAVGVASTAVWVVLTAFFAVNIGVTALVARATGAKDRDVAGRAAAQGILLSAAAGTVMLVGAVPLAELITHALGVSGQVASLAAAFIRIYSLALPATGIASACTAAMRGAGDARRPLLVMLIVNGLNIVASWLLLNGSPALHIAPFGVIGSAIGAATGWICGAVLALTLLSRRHPCAPRLALAALRPDRALAARILRVGLPSAAELVVFQVGIVSFLRAVVPLGATVYAANTSINTVESMGTLPGFGFSVATTTLVGQALGAADPDLAVRVVWTALRPCILVMGGIGLLALLAPHLVLGLFVADPQVLHAGDLAMRLSFFTLPMSASAFVFIGALRGAGDTRFPVIVRAAGTWGLRLPAAALLIPWFGLPGARAAMSLDYTAQAAITYLRLRGGRWRRAKV
jgi:putative MATE family efflux protein